MLIPLGAALEARDRVGGALGGLRTTAGSRGALDRQLARFERRGGRARTELEREVRRTRSRLERGVRHSRTRVERQASEARRGFEHQRAEARRALSANVETLQARVAPLRERGGQVRGRVENVVQNGVSAGRRLVGDAQDRISRGR